MYGGAPGGLGARWRRIPIAAPLTLSFTHPAAPMSIAPNAAAIAVPPADPAVASPGRHEPPAVSRFLRGAGARIVFAAVLLVAGAILLWSLRDRVSLPALQALGVFGAAVIAWVVLQLDETPVALAAGLALVLIGVVPADRLFGALGDDLVWLLLGGFVVAAALQSAGLAERWAFAVVRGTRSVASLVMRLTLGIAATAFIVPSTSARAVPLLPVFLVLARAIGDLRVTRALALLFPSVILLSAGASLLGAGAHLIAVDLLRRIGLEAPGVLGWAWLAAPFALACSLVAAGLILILFLKPEERRRRFALPDPPVRELTALQRRTGVIAALSVVGFAAGPWLGIPPALVALAAALLITVRPLTGVDLASALRRVDWNLLLFLAATLVLGHALVDTGAADALARLAVPAPVAGRPAIVWIALASVVAVLAHLLITSRTARAVVLLPAVALPMATAAGLNPAILVLVMVLGSGYCQTLVVSAKPVLLYSNTEVPTYRAGDLLRLSVVLGPLVLALLVGFAAWVWPAQGLALRTA